MQRTSSVAALLRQGSSPALLRRSEQSPALPRGSVSPAVQRPATSSSGAGMSQRQPSMSNHSANGILKHGGLAALLRQASSPGMQRQEGGVHRQGGRHGSSPAVQRPEGVVAGVHRQGGRDSVPRQGRSPELQRAEGSAAAPQRQGSRAGAVRGNSPALQRIGSLPSPVVAADFARRGSAGLSAFPSGDLAGRGERVGASCCVATHVDCLYEQQKIQLLVGLINCLLRFTAFCYVKDATRTNPCIVLALPVAPLTQANAPSHVVFSDKLLELLVLSHSQLLSLSC